MDYSYFYIGRKRYVTKITKGGYVTENPYSVLAVIKITPRFLRHKLENELDLIFKCGSNQL